MIQVIQADGDASISRDFAVRPPRCDMSEEEIFLQARNRRDPEQRAAFLEHACGGDAALRASVEALLRADVGATGFMERPAPAPAATGDAPTGERPGTV